jgi:light-harvesting complex 1 beta chain
VEVAFASLARRWQDSLMIKREETLMSDESSLTGLTNDEAKEFHDAYVKGFLGFTAVALVAHILVWMWRPWL